VLPLFNPARSSEDQRWLFVFLPTPKPRRHRPGNAWWTITGDHAIRAPEPQLPNRKVKYAKKDSTNSEEASSPWSGPYNSLPTSRGGPQRLVKNSDRNRGWSLRSRPRGLPSNSVNLSDPPWSPECRLGTSSALPALGLAHGFWVQERRSDPVRAAAVDLWREDWATTTTQQSRRTPLSSARCTDWEGDNSNAPGSTRKRVS
jgi:hypothetical protein